MKKTALLLAFAAMFVSSCKKNYTCTCTESITVGTSTTTGTAVYIIPDATQQVAAADCKAFEVYAANNTQTRTCSL